MLCITSHLKATLSKKIASTSKHKFEQEFLKYFWVRFFWFFKIYLFDELDELLPP